MAFKCEKCKKAQSAGTAPIRVVTETRYKEYPVRTRNYHTIDKGGVGTEIVKEGNYCSPCAITARTA